LDANSCFSIPRFNRLELAKLKLSKSEEAAKKLRVEIGEKEITLKVLREELQGLQMEYCKKDELVNKLTNDNKELVNRYHRYTLLLLLLLSSPSHLQS
jgi:hypothetical protein